MTSFLHTVGVQFLCIFQIDRMYDWQRNPSGSVRDTLKRQKANTKSEFEERAKQTIAEFAEQVSN